MKKIIGIFCVLILATSCEIEQLTPEDVEVPVTEDTTTTPEVDPASIDVPCSLVQNNFYLNFENSSVSSVGINYPGLSLTVFDAGYGLNVNLVGSSDLEVYFKSAPTSGYFSGNGSSLITESNDIVMRKLEGGSYYYAVDEATVYVQDYPDSTVVSWCDVDFEGPSLTLYGGKGNFTVHK